MSTDVATLVLAVDANQVAAGGKALDAFTNKGKEAESQTGKLTSATNILSKAYGDIAKAFAAWKVADFVKDTSMIAARFETMGIVMKIAGNNAGYTREQAEKYSKALQEQGISMMQSRDAIVQLSTANIDLAKAQDLGRAAQDLAVVAGINSSEAMERMIHGIKAGEVEILRTLGMNVSWEASYKRTAAQLGTTSDKLTEQQKVMSRTNEVIREGIKYQGIYEEAMGTAGKAITSLTRYWDNLKIKMGEVFLPALSEAVNDLTTALKTANVELDRAGSEGTITSIGKTLAGAFTIVKETVLVLGANVSYVFAGIGRELGGLAAQAVAFSKLNFAAISGIREAMLEDNQSASKALTAFENSVMKVGKGNATQLEESMANARASSKKTEEQRIAEGIATRKAQEAEAALLAKKGNKGKSGPSEVDTYNQLIKAIYEKTAATALEDDGTRKLTESENTRARLLYDLTNGQIKLTTAHKSTILAKLNALEIAEREKAAAIAYSKAMQELNGTVVNADDSTRELDAAQKVLLETMRQPDWENMPDVWKQTAIATTATASAQLEVIKNQKELNDLIDQTPTVKLEKSREQMVRLADAYMDGKLGIIGSTEAVEKYAEVVNVALGRNADTLQKETDALDEFTKSAAQNMQKALADFLFDPFAKGTQTMLQQFGTMVRQMIAQAVAADLMKRLFGDMGKTGEVGGWIGSLLKGISGISGGGSSASTLVGSDVPIGVIPSGSFAVGTDYVPYDMIAKIHKGEKITPASENKQNDSSNSGDSVYNMTVVVPAGSPSEIRRAAGIGAREALSAFRGAQRYA